MTETSTECKRCNNERKSVRGNLLTQMAHAQLVLTSLADAMEGDDRVCYASDNVLDFSDALTVLMREVDA